MRRTNCIVVFITFLIVFVESLPIEIKDIEYLFPPQNTFFDSANGEYLTKIDKQIDSEEESTIKKACQPKLENSADDENILKNDGEDYPGGSFNDTTPFNGTIVDDPMEVKIYKPECDD